MKKIFFALLLVIVLGVAAFFIWRLIEYAADANPDKTFLLPRVELSIVEIYSMTPEKIELNIKLLMENHLPVKFSADSVDFAVFVEDTEVLRDRYQKSIDLEAGDSSWVSLPLTLLAKKLITVLEENESNGVDSVEYRLAMSFHSDLLVKKHFDLDVARTLPLLYIPEIVERELKIDSLNFSEADLTLHLSVKNENAFPIHAKDIAYKFAIEGHEWIEGNIPGLTRINAKDITHLDIPMTLTLKEVTRSLYDLLLRANKVQHQMLLTFTVQSQNETVKNSEFILKSEGSLKSLRRTTKELEGR